MSGMFGTKSPKATKPTPINGLQVQTSSYGLPVPLRYGRNRGAGQLIDWQGFRAVEHAQKQKTGGKGGGGGGNTSYSYTYNVTPLLALGEGPLLAINRVWKDDAVQTLAQSGFTFLTGSWTQTAWSYMTSKFPTHARTYIGTAYVGGADLDLGDNASLSNYNFDISGLCYLTNKPGGKPGDILTDYLTHAQHGAGFNYLSPMAGSDFEKYCLARGIYLSPFEETQRPASDFVNDVATACNSAIVWSQSKLKLVPYGDETIVGTDGTYVPNLTPEYDITEDDYLSSSQGSNGGYVTIDQKPLEQAYNHIQLEIVDGDNDFVVTVVEAKDQADIDARGLRSKAVMQRHDITDVDVGRDVAQMMLQRELYVINTYTFSLTVRHSLLDLMDLLTINDKVNGIVQQLVRITEIEEQDDGVLLTTEEVLANASHAPRYSTQRGSGYLPDLGVDPGIPNHVQLINAPALLCDTGYELWLAAASTNANWGGAQVWVSKDNVNYELAGTLTGPSRMGVLTSSVASYGGTQGSVDGVALVNVTIDRGFIFPGTDDTRDEFTTLCYLADNSGEFIAYRDAALTGTLSYQIGNLCRGGYGTHANSHAAGAMFVRCDDCLFRLPYDRNMANKTLYVKLLSYNIYGGALQSLADVTAKSIVLKPNTGNGPVRGGDQVLLGLAAAADNAQTTADAATAQLTDIASDGKLTAAEKISSKQRYNTLTAEQTGIDAQATSYGVTTEKTNYDGAITALKNYLKTTVGVLDASFVWTGITGTTAITRSTWDTNWTTVYTAKTTLLNKIYAVAKTKADGAQSAADAAAGDAAAALSQLSDIASDSKLTANEKLVAKQRYDAAKAEQAGIDSQADSYYITSEKTNYDNAMSALKTYLKTTVGVLDASFNWTGTTGTTAITRSTWDTNWENLYGTRATLKNAIYAAANKFTYGVNLLRNPTGSAGFFGWGGFIGGAQQTMNTVVDGGIGPGFACTLSGTSLDQGCSQTVYGSFASQPVTFSCQIYNGHMLTGSTIVQLRFNNSSGVEIDTSNRPAVTSSYANAVSYYQVTGTCPAGCTQISVIMRSTGTGNGVTRWYQLKLETGSKATPFDASTNIADQLGVPGSGVRIGDSRNLRAVIYANYASGWSGLTFTTSTSSTNCAISASAATLRSGSVAVAYNASSTNVAGSAGQTKTIYLYYEDDNLDGGAETLNATTSLITALSGDARVMLGSVTVTYPSSGSTGGGGGGYCPDEDAWVLMADPNCRLADWCEQAKNVKIGDWLRDTDGGMVQVTGSERREALRSRVVGRSGYSITCSSIAPLELAPWIEHVDPGTCLAAYMCASHSLRILAEYPAMAEHVDRVEDVGWGWVQHISCSDRRFWVGDDQRMLFGHHNLKPLVP
jgi:hypothetical protein